MIKLENVVLPNLEQMKFVIEGMRNSMNSRDKSDSHTCRQDGSFCMECKHKSTYHLGENDYSLMKRLAKAGTDHRKFMRMMPVYVRITAPLYWWKEFDTYNVTKLLQYDAKITEKEFTLEDFSVEHLETIARFDDDGEPHQPYMLIKSVIDCLNACRKTYLETKSKTDWWQMIQLIPSSYNQTRNVMLDYEVLKSIYRQQEDISVDEWKDFCRWIKKLPYSDLITGENNKF